MIYCWLVVWLPFFIFPEILGISSSQLTFIFFRGVAQPPTRLYFVTSWRKVQQRLTKTEAVRQPQFSLCHDMPWHAKNDWLGCFIPFFLSRLCIVYTSHVSFHLVDGVSLFLAPTDRRWSMFKTSRVYTHGSMIIWLVVWNIRHIFLCIYI